MPSPPFQTYTFEIWFFIPFYKRSRRWKKNPMICQFVAIFAPMLPYTSARDYLPVKRDVTMIGKLITNQIIHL